MDCNYFCMACGKTYLGNPSEHRCTTKPDNVNHPPHYTNGGIECIDAIQAALTPLEWRGYIKGNCIKYLWREQHKHGDNDLAKAQWYLNRLLTGKETE